MRALATTTAKGVARVLVSWLLPSKTNDLLKNDQDQPMNDLDLFHIPRSPQPSAAPVGNDAHMRS
eukprot:CAMPEP_0119474730 /NCGR_PEP_ID=MMETSP1344-20130328/5873_1 /TAXON_ID=236787 /ORGANISM="Florenciella parvula, Strain CCMP2471" /LENGTH=64 /DNA_ID=CAMNT_0007508077 /DNA_START=157 /DNA_END=351 /DNA_ORIENTATION=+